MARIDAEAWLTDDKLTQIRGWKMNGVTDEEIAKNIGIARRTLINWRSKYPELQEALQNGRDEANYTVEQALYKNAIDGNMTAIIFWLKNNYSSKYSDAQKTPLEEELTKRQIAKADSDAKIAKLKVKILEMQLEGDKTEDILAKIMETMVEAAENDLEDGDFDYSDDE